MTFRRGLCGFLLLFIVVYWLLCTYIRTSLHVSLANIFGKKHADVTLKTCNIEEVWRFECDPDAGKTKEDCIGRGCCWLPPNTRSGPSCFYPSDFITYHVEKNGTKTVDIVGEASKMRHNDIKRLRVVVSEFTQTHLNIRIIDPTHARWEVPMFAPPSHQKKDFVPDYLVHINDPFSIVVKRRLSGKLLLNTSVGALVYGDQFLQMTSLLPSHVVYGLGVHGDKMLRSVNWTRHTLWNRDYRSKENINLYGSHPFYMAHDEPGKFHGVFLLNSNAMEVVFQPTPAVTWRTIGGILDFHIFTGPDPSSVVKQYTSVIGRSHMPPYWSLGYHLCRWGYKTAEGTMAVVERNRKAGVPLEVQWNDNDYAYEMLGFTYDSKRFGDLPGLVNRIHELEMHYMMIFDPGVSNNHSGYAPYETGIKMDIFIKNSSGNPLIGKVWPGTTVFPDFTDPKGVFYWNDMVRDFHQKVHFDGMWIDMNEISNFVIGSIDGCPESSLYENPPYVPKNIRGGTLRSYTLCATAKHTMSVEYNVHNLYGFMEARASYFALADVRKKRPFVISRSSYPGTGTWSGVWTGDNFADFYDLKASISSILTMNMLGISVIGADICGFHNNTNEELCARWHQLGAFYPFMRNHNDRPYIAHDPAVFADGIIKTISHAISIRYCLLPYLYTLFFKSHRFGETVVRPMFFEWAHLYQLYNVDSQFMIGSYLLFAPVTTNHTDFVHNSTGRYYYTTYTAIFPRGTWYQYLCADDSNKRDVFHVEQDLTKKKFTSVLSTNASTVSSLPVYVRPGSIIPSFYEPAATATKNRLSAFSLTISLNDSLQAEGDLFWDDGESFLPIFDDEQPFSPDLYNFIEFHVSENTLYSRVVHHGYKSAAMSLAQIRVFGIQLKPRRVTVNEVVVNTWKFITDQNELVISSKTLLTLVNDFNVTWT